MNNNNRNQKPCKVSEALSPDVAKILGVLVEHGDHIKGEGHEPEHMGLRAGKVPAHEIEQPIDGMTLKTGWHRIFSNNIL